MLISGHDLKHFLKFLKPSQPPLPINTPMSFTDNEFITIWCVATILTLNT